MKKRPLLLGLAVLIVGPLLHLPWIAEPFGPTEVNAAMFYGPFARSFREFGFADLRGVPLGRYGVQAAHEGLPYLDHPPAFAWMNGWGTAEWQIRLVPVLLQALAGLLLFILLLRPLGPWRAAAAAALIEVAPVLAFFATPSYETGVLVFGLSTFIAYVEADRRDGVARTAWLAVLAAVAAIGAWIDWAYAFWLIALIPLATFPLTRRRAAPVVLAGLVALGSVGGVLFWRRWAIEAPIFHGLQVAQTEDIAASIWTSRPGFREYFIACFEQLRQGFTWPTLAVAALGLIPFAVRAPRLAIGFLVPAVLNIGIFARHAMTHVFPHAYLAPLVGAAVGSVVLHRSRAGRIVALGAILVALGSSAWRTVCDYRESRTTIFRDIGTVLDEASADFDETGAIRRVYRVRYGLPNAYIHYIRSPVTFPGIVGPELLERERTDPTSPLGLRYLHFVIDVVPPTSALAAGFPVMAPLEEYLARFDYVDVPSLEQVVRIPDLDTALHVRSCSLYTLKP